MWQIIIFICTISTVICEECQPVPAKENLDIKQMEGWWYMQYRSQETKGIDPNYKCMMQYWFIKPNGNVFAVEATLKKEGPKTSEGGSYWGEGYRNSTNGIIWFELWENDESEIGPLYIIDSDYKNYMITSYCQGATHGKWIFSRERSGLSNEAKKSVEEALKTAQLTFGYFEESPHTQCP